VSDISIREGGPQDAAALRRLVAETIEEPDELAPIDPARGDDVVFVAEVSGHPAGYAAARVEGSELVVDRILVAPADRGRQVGNRLLDWLEGYGTNRHLGRIRIAVEDENRAARDFYTRRGYAPCEGAVERELIHPPD
jgi:ribosomal protein S18 acetylase RimI-like enzyme